MTALPAVLAEEDKIVVTRAICGSFGTGYCFSTKNPYYTGHHPTRLAAIKAAKAKRDQMKSGRSILHQEGGG